MKSPLIIASIFYLIIVTFCGCSTTEYDYDYQEWNQPVGYPVVQERNTRQHLIHKYRQGRMTRDEWWRWQEANGEKLTVINKHGFEREARIVNSHHYNNFGDFIKAVIVHGHHWDAPK